MSIIFFLLFFLSCTSYVLCTNSTTNNDEYMLFKMKRQLGNPDILGGWTKGFNYCETTATTATTESAIVHATCTDTGRVSGLRMKNLDVSAPFPTAVCGLTELESFEIYHIPGLYGLIPSCVTKLLNLRGFIIEETSLSGSVPKFYNNTSLTVISLPRNNLSGAIPRSLSTLSNLQNLDLSSNNLTGTIPPGIVHSMLILSDNNLSGKIPKSYGSVDLWVIIVRNNRLSGDASFLFRKQKNAANIDLAHNNFEFNLSNVEFSDKLMMFNISHNKIYGNVSDSFANATSLLYPDLSFNRLCGELPKGGNMEGFDASVFTNNTCLCGNPLPSCFNSAPAPAPVYP